MGLSMDGGDQAPDLMGALRRQWLTVVVAALLAVLGAWVYASSLPVVYQARSSLLLEPGAQETSPTGGRNRSLDVDTWATVARSTELLAEVATELKLDLEDVRSRTTATAAPTGDVVVLTFEGPSEQAAVAGAAVYNEAFLAERRVRVNADTVERQQQLERLKGDITAQIGRLVDELAAEEARGDSASASKLNVLTASQQNANERLDDINTELSTLDPNAETGRVIIEPGTAVDRAGLGLPLITLSGLLLGALLGLILALLRDRYDDRYRKVREPEQFGLREVAHVPYAPGRGRRSRDAMLAYSRLITRLTFAQRGLPEIGRSMLLLPIESKTMPFDAARQVASALDECGSMNGIAIGVWGEDVLPEDTRAYWEATILGVKDLRASHDLVLVPERALDYSASGIGLAALVDDTLLVVSDDTPMRSIELALEDLRGVNVERVQVIVLTDIRRRDLRRASAEARPSSRSHADE